MRKARLILLLLTALAMLVVVRSTEAKNRDKAWEFGASISNVDADRDNFIDNSIGYGISFGYNFTSKITAELFITKTSTDHFHMLDFATFQSLATGKFVSDPNTMSVVCTNLTTCVEPQFQSGDEFLRSWVQVTGNFLTDRDTRTIPYVSAGLGVIRETREGYPYLAVVSTDLDPNTPNIQVRGQVPESFDASALLTLAVGGRTFFSDNWGIRYELRYAHHNSFEVNQDEYLITIGGTWLVGGQK